MNDWEHEAKHWLAWARTPGHDAYWHYRHAFFELLPDPRQATLEVGCGEGRVARDLQQRGHRVTGIDTSPTLLQAAEEADPCGDYLLAEATQLPFPDTSFDLVVAYNSLMDIEDMPGAVKEAARVLRPDGRLCATVTHPMNEGGEDYLTSQPFDESFTRDGLTMTFHGWTHPLEDYFNALERAGLVVEALREPKGAEPRWQRRPMFLMLRARR